MLLTLKMNNIYIYESEVEFSMLADMRYRRFASNTAAAGKVHALKSAVVFGPNNAGKTNLVRVLRLVRKVILNKKPPFEENLFTGETVCEFSVTFEHESREYIFEVKFDTRKSEYVYERFAEVYRDEYGNKREDNYLIRDSIHEKYESKDNVLVSSMGVVGRNNLLMYLLDTEKFPVLKEMQSVLTAFAKKIVIVDMNDIPIKKTIDMLKKGEDEQQKIARFILNADLALDDYRYLSDDEFKRLVSIEAAENSEQPQEKVLQKKEQLIELLHLMSVYKGVPVPSLFYDSTGTKKIASLASYVIDALEKGEILVVDELDNSLHFKLTRAIIAMFNNELNKNAQLIATVHDVMLLDCQKLFRKEQIWFAHKDKDSVYLYSLAEFTAEDGIRDTTDLIGKYKQGILGALPEPDLFQSLLEVQGNG